MSSGRGRVNFCQDPLHHSSQTMHQHGQLLQQSGQPTQEPVYAQPVKKADREKEKSEQPGVYSKPSYEVQTYRQTRNSPQSPQKRYSTYSPKSERYGGPVSPLAKEERYSPCKSTNLEERGSPLRIPLAQEEQYSPGPEGRPSPKLVPSRNMSMGGGNNGLPRNVNVATGSQVIYAHRKEAAARPRSLHFQAAVKRD